MRFLVTGIFLIITYFASAQNNGYVPLVSKGEMPESFVGSVMEGLDEDIDKEVNNSDSQSVKKSKATFVLKSNYMLNNILTGGYVLYNEEVSNYVSDVLNVVLQESKHQSDAVVYVIKSPQVNAFCTSQGIMFVTTGLLAQLENEAQLAYILGHELTHYDNKHSINQYIESDKYFAKKSGLRNSKQEDYIKKMSSFSKSLELEADSVAFKLLNRTQYDLKASLSVFDVLQFSHLPFDEIEFDKSIFETEHFKLPKSFYLDTLTPINFDEDYDDSKSSHPNIKKRKGSVKEYLSNVKYVKGKVNVLGEDRFNSVKKRSRDEVLRILLRSGYYVEALYNAKVMAEESPNVNYYKGTMAKALYGIAKYKNNTGNASGYSYEDMEGAISKYYFFFEQFNDEDLNLVCLNAIIELNKEYKSEFITKLIDNLAIDAVVNHEVVSQDFIFDPTKLIDREKVEAQDTLVEEVVADTINDENRSKYEKIKALKNDWNINTPTGKNNKLKIGLEAFVDADSILVKELFEKAHTSSKDYIGSGKDEEISYREYKKQKKAYGKKKNNLGIDKLVYVDPEFFSVDERKGVKLENSEQNQVNFVNDLKHSLERSPLDGEVLSSKLFTTKSTNELNDIGALNAVMGEVLSHLDQEFNVDFIPLESEYSKSLKDKYGTANFCYAGVLTYKSIKRYKATVLLATIVYFPALPFGIYYAVTPKYFSQNYHIIGNVETGQVIYYDNVETKTKLNVGNVNSLMYDKMIQFKSEKK